ncbi:MAG: hypothetical protein JXA22_03510 [Candidatus Thermoplasmatota archaeon]|nr:hypothetical protein [Candidatus Thermoplasmatota archaeon]
MRARIPAMVIAVMFLLLTLPNMTHIAVSKQSTPDGGGYRYTDAMDPEPKIEVDYLDIKSHPNVVNYNVDNYYYYVEANLGFDFEYYGQTFNKIRISIYGAMSFVETNGNSYNDPWGYSLPSTSSPKGLIAVNWRTDTAYSGTGRLYSLQTTIDSENAFIVDWNTQGGAQYQAILFETGMILFQYKSASQWYVPGSYTIIGIESPDSTTGTAYVSRYEYSSNPKFNLPFAIAFTKEDMSVDRIELTNGDGSRQDKIYAGSKPYIFRTDVSHSKTRDDIMSATMTLGSLWGQEGIKLVYFHQNRTFYQLTGLEHANLLTDMSKTEVRNSNTISIYFYVDFKIPYPSEERRNVTVRATGKSAIPSHFDLGDVYYVEDDLEWDTASLIARKTSGDGGFIQDGSYVAGGEVVQFSGFRIFYERSTVQPPPSLVQLNISDNHGTNVIVHIPQNGQLSASWTALDVTSVMTLEFRVYGVPLDNMVNEPDNFIFTFRVDATPPGGLNKATFKVFQDQLDGGEEPYDADNDIHYDNDDNIYLKWETITDGESGPGSYLISVTSEEFSLEKVVKVTDPSKADLNTHIGENYREYLPQGRFNISIRAVDIVGNIGPAIYTTLIIDRTGPLFRVVSPALEEWAHSARPIVTVNITDSLSPIEGQTLVYRVSTNGGFTFSEWESFQFYGRTRKELELEITPKLTEGKENMLQFKGEDIAQSGPVTSQNIPIWVDQRPPSISMIEPQVDESGTTVEWLKTANEPIRISIHDFKGRGVDPSRISYRYSLGGGGFSADIPLEGDPYNNTLGYEEYTFTIRKDTWQEGDENLLVVDVWDLTGKNTTAVFRIRLDVTPEVTILSPDPTGIYLDNSNITFSVKVEDRDGNEDVSVSWMSNVDGPLGYRSTMSTILSAGQHIITITVDDDVHTTKRSFSIVVLSHVLMDPAFMDSDNDGMNDSYEMEFGFDPNEKDGHKDLDDDTFTNLEEYLAGTDPTDKKDYPGSTIKESSFPILPLILIILGLLGLMIFGALTVRESNRTQQAVMPLPPAYYGWQTSGPALPPERPALPP